jgi:hypothetical protein
MPTEIKVTSALAGLLLSVARLDGSRLGVC